ncbi:thiamine pyrophosphate-binding protein [Williamsia soli]|uniref:thiamine pyrophosphate-binding protein n=1 Tax=Williamsia soli TaxID=364929 RepID=UPI001A9D9DF7|nr:thiamine pyrophosphate-binding protein [Williamsia soli]
MKGYEAIALAIQHFSDAPVFGVMGNANMLIFAALSAEGDERLVSARHEAAAVAMADGYARTSGAVGVSTVTSGPGLSQVATSLLAAARYRSPQVLISGDAYRRDSARLQAFDQQAFADTCESGFVPIKRVQDIVPAVHEAFARATLESRPVLLSIPEDLQLEEAAPSVEAELQALARPQRAATPAPRDSEVERVVDLLEAAKYPVFIVGRGCRDEETIRAVRELAEHYGALLATSLPAKGRVDDDEWSIGVSGGFAHTGARELLQRADLVVGCAAGLASYTTDKTTLYPSATTIALDLEQTPESAMLGHDVVLGDVAETVPRLLAAARNRSDVRVNFRGSDEQEHLKTLSAEAAATIDERSDGIHPAAVAETLRKSLPIGAQVVLGGGHFWAFAVMGIHKRPDLRWQFSYQFGSIGQTLPVAIGAWYGDPSRRLVVIDGDGSVLMHIQELDTVARYRIPMTLIVANDGAFGAEVHKLRPAGLTDTIATFDAPDFAAIGEAFGGTGIHVKEDAALASALEQNTGLGRFEVLDVRISGEVPSEPFKRWYYGG